MNLERKQFPLLYVHQHSRGIVGWGAHKMAGMECQMYGIKHALLVTTGLKGTGIVEEVEGCAQGSRRGRDLVRRGHLQSKRFRVQGRDQGSTRKRNVTAL